MGSAAQMSDFLLTGGCHFYFVGLNGGNHWPESFMGWVVFSVGLCPLEIGRQATSKEFIEWIQGQFPLANIGFPTSWESWLYLGLPGGKLVAGEGRRGWEVWCAEGCICPCWTRESRTLHRGWSDLGSPFHVALARLPRPRLTSKATSLPVLARTSWKPF